MLALRSHQPTTSLAAAIRDTVRAMDPDLPVFEVYTMDELLARQRWSFRVFGTLFVLFAIFGLVLSTIGMYAVTAYGVGQRRSEIAVRMALGAQQTHVAWIVLRRGVVQLSIGLPLGLALAYAVMFGMRTLLVGIKPGDPATLAAIVGIVSAVTVVACVLPAARAARLNPVAALRN
jgi:putative ABC transport system permease protein